MNIQKVSDINFKGYDARTLRGFFMSSNCHNIAQEMSSIGKKEGFKIYTVSGERFLEGLPKYSENTIGLWAQDMWTIIKNKLLGLEYDKKFYAIKNALELKLDFTEKISHETDVIRELNQNIWDIFDELGMSNVNQKSSLNNVAKDFELKKMQLFKYQKEAHIPGGNLFVIKGDKGDEILIGENEIEKFSIDEIKAMFLVDRVTVLPQMDYHLDLFIRPLDKKRILVADDNKTLEILKSGLQKLSDYMQNLPNAEKVRLKETYLNFKNYIIDFENAMEKNKLPSVNLVCDKLKANGYRPIRVAGRFYRIYDENDSEQSLQHICNYMNANTIKNKKNEIIYMTNKSNLDSMLGITPELSQKIGFSFEKSFINSISRFVKPSKIYFIKGDNNFVADEMLSIYQGGIHCACTEIPKGVNIKCDKSSKSR